MRAEQAPAEAGTAPVTTLLDTAAQADGGLVHGDERLGWAEVKERSDRLAAGLASLGVGAGDPVALVLPNVPAFAIAFFAIARLGAVVVPLNPNFKDAELDFHFREAGVRAVVTYEGALATCEAIVSRWGDDVRVLSDATLDALIEEHGPAPADAGRPDAEAVFQ